MQDMIEIGNMFRELGLSEMTVKDGDFEISLKKADDSETSEKKTDLHQTEAAKAAEVKNHVAVPTGTAASQMEAGETKEDGIAVTAPLPGIFYGSESDQAESFVKVGDSVEPDTVVCAIEAMKMLNNVKAGTSGRIKKVCVSQGQMVEFGQTLFLIEKE